MGTIHWALNQA
jgi:hypothetical protein